MSNEAPNRVAAASNAARHAARREASSNRTRHTACSSAGESATVPVFDERATEHVASAEAARTPSGSARSRSTQASPSSTHAANGTASRHSTHAPEPLWRSMRLRRRARRSAKTPPPARPARIHRARYAPRSSGLCRYRLPNARPRGRPLRFRSPSGLRGRGKSAPSSSRAPRTIPPRPPRGRR